MGVVIRQSFKGTIITYIGAFIGFLTTFFVSTEFLSPEEIGLTRVLLDAGLLISGIALLGIPHSAPKFFPYFKNPEKKNNGFFFYLICLSFLGMILTLTGTFIFKETIKAFFSREAPLFVDYFYLIFPLGFFLVYQTVFDSYAAVLMRIVIPRFVREVLVRMMTLIIFLLYAFRFIDLDCMIYLYTAEYGIAVLIDLIYISHIGTVSISFDISYVRKPLRKYVSRFTGYMMITTLGVEIINRAGTFMISSYEGLNSTGIYSIALFMAAVVEIPSRSLNSISIPLLSSHMKEKQKTEAEELLKKVSLNQFLIGAFVFTILWINIDNVFAVLPKGNIYADGKMVVFFLGLARLCDLIGNISVVTLNISKYYYVLFIVILVSVISILGNYLLIPLLGITGSAVSTVVSLTVYYLIVIVFVNVKLKFNPLSKGILKVILLTGCIFLLNHFLFTLSNPMVNAVVRTLLLGGLFLLVMYFWKISQDINSLIEKIFDKVISFLKLKK